MSGGSVNGGSVNGGVSAYRCPDCGAGEDRLRTPWPARQRLTANLAAVTSRRPLRRGVAGAAAGHRAGRMRSELLAKDWSAITLTDVARAAGVSRQTIYNEFGSRLGLAQAYALRLADRLVDDIDGAINAHVGDVYGAFLAGSPSSRPRCRRPAGHLATVRGGQARPVAARHHRLRYRSSRTARPGCRRLSCRAGFSPARRTPHALARATVRLAMSYVSMPVDSDSAGDHDVATDLARLMTPFAERYGAG